MGYSWEQHRQTCYRLYVEENRPLDEVVRYMREHHDFTPSRRAFQGAFARWGFPSKLKPAYKNEQLVARVKELWERNLSQKEMLSKLHDEGYEISEREVARIRAKNGWLIRDSSGQTARGTLNQRGGESAERVLDDRDGNGSASGVSAVGHQDSNSYWDYRASGLEAAGAQVQEETLKAMREARREYRKRVLEAEAHERWLTKKRRRHTRPYGGLPADPPGPPRFPSETTLSEAKEILQMDKYTYMALREKFYTMCQNAGVYKKTLVGPERWESLKDQLVRESMHLRAVMWDDTDMDKKRLAIEIICCDVTKRIRTEATAVKVADAKVILGLNPEEGRSVRKQLYNILALENFTSKLEDGLEYFEELKQRWIAESPELTRSIAVGPADPEYQRKVKAINVLCRDAVRRYRTDPLLPHVASRPALAESEVEASQQVVGAPFGRDVPAVAETQNSLRLVQYHGYTAAQRGQTYQQQQQKQQQQQHQQQPTQAQASSGGIAAFFRLSSDAAMMLQGAQAQWIAPLTERTMTELRDAALQKTPGGLCYKIEGLVKDGKGGELPLLVSDEAELETYLQHVQSQGHGAPTFQVHVVPGGDAAWS
ncbi:hypothetical protein P885DRAFT_31414 [Corynascus similis CBS 632.67]